MIVPTGMLRSGKLLPGLMSARRPHHPHSAPSERGCNDVHIHITEQSNTRTSVRIVLDGLNPSWYVLIATEIDNTIASLMTTTTTTNRNPTVSFDQRFGSMTGELLERL